ncbi:MAG: T9SS type A sorting domain-containing protein [Paludibacter sp.]|jgi:hypothetical protein|nr:T9SS type A sorting domain-containing protein [Paludibacter sp.]
MKKRNFTQLLLVAAVSLFSIQSAMAVVPNPPEALPAAPTHDAGIVKSVFSGAYTNAAIISGFSGVGDIKEIRQVLGDDMIYIENGLNEWANVEFASALSIDGYKVLFMDVYVVATAFNLKLSLGDGSSTFSIPVVEGWNKVEIDLNDYRVLATPPDMTNITKLGFLNDAGYPRTIYVDNIYAANVVPTEILTGPTVAGPNTQAISATSVLPIFSDVYPNEVGCSLLPETVGLVKKLKGLNFSGSTALDKMFFIKNGLNSGGGGYLFTHTVDATAYEYIHVDFFLDGTSFPVRFRFGVNTATFTGSVSPNPTSALYTAQPGWNSVNLKFSDLTSLLGTLDLTQLNGFGFFNKSGYARTVYVDNLYLYSTSPTTAVNELQGDVVVSTFPNPASGQVVVESSSSISKVDLISINGQKLQTVHGIGNRFHVNISDNACGVYILNVTLENGQTVTQRVVKQ